MSITAPPLSYTETAQKAYQKAYHFAAHAHGNQLYPGTSISYIMHLSFVSMEILMAHHHHPIQNLELAIQCALLHDTLEDTPLQRQTLLEHFDRQVVEGVEALTKNERLPKNERMQDSLNRIQRCPAEVGMVKLADRISNLQKPPTHWSIQKCKAYQQEARLILSTLGDSHPYLRQRLTHQIEQYTAFFS